MSSPRRPTYGPIRQHKDEETANTSASGAHSAKSGGGGSRTHVRNRSMTASTCVALGKATAARAVSIPLASVGGEFCSYICHPPPRRHVTFRDYPGLDTPNPKPLAALESDGSQLSSESEVLVVVGTCRVSSGIYEGAEILDTQPPLARPRRNRFAPEMVPKMGGGGEPEAKVWARRHRIWGHAVRFHRLRAVKERRRALGCSATPHLPRLPTSVNPRANRGQPATCFCGHDLLLSHAKLAVPLRSRDEVACSHVHSRLPGPSVPCRLPLPPRPRPGGGQHGRASARLVVLRPPSARCGV